MDQIALDFSLVALDPLDVYVIDGDVRDFYIKEEITHFADERTIRKPSTQDLLFLQNKKVRRDYIGRSRHRRRAYIALLDATVIWSLEHKQYEIAPDPDVLLTTLPTVEDIVAIKILQEPNLPVRFRITFSVADKIYEQDVRYETEKNRFMAGAVWSLSTREIFEPFSLNYVIRHLQNTWMQNVAFQEFALASLPLQQKQDE